MSRPIARRFARSGCKGLAACLLASAILGSACTPSHDEAWQVSVGALVVHSDGDTPSAAWTRRSLFAALGRSVLLTPATGDEGLSMNVEYWELPPKAADGSRDLVVELQLESPDLVRAAKGPEFLGATVMLERRGTAGEGLEGDLKLALGRAVTVLDARTRLAMNRPEQAQALLQSEDPELIVLALEWVNEHRARAHAQRVGELLVHPQAKVRRAAVETLGQVGGPEQVRALIAQLRLADPLDAEASYRALATMGGADAERFLRFAAENEDEPSQRRAATIALRSVSRPQDAPRQASRRSHRR